MSATSRAPIPVELLGEALRALTWEAQPESTRAATRGEMLGMLRFIVEAELVGDEALEKEADAGYLAAIDVRARQDASTDLDLGEKTVKILMTQLYWQVTRTGYRLGDAVMGADTRYKTSHVVDALADALAQLVLIPGTMDPDTRERGTPALVRYAVERSRKCVQEAMRHMADTRAQLSADGA